MKPAMRLTDSIMEIHGRKEISMDLNANGTGLRRNN
jgi:hypothetical protein